MQRGKALNRYIDYYLGIPLLNILATFKVRQTYPENPKLVGLLFNPALGDTLLASAATQDIRSLFPTAKLILFAATSNVAAARLLPGIDEIDVLPITRPYDAIKKLRQSKLDLMLDFTSWQRITALYSLMSRAKYTVGFDRKGQFRRRAYDRTVPHLGNCHELDNLRRFTSSLGAQTAHAPRLMIADDCKQSDTPQRNDLVVFHAWASGTKSYLREWPNDNWVALAKQLMATGRRFIITGSLSDAKRCEELKIQISKAGIPVDILIGQNGIEEIARTLQSASLLVSVNTGIMHLGAILGVPTVALNGPNSADRWGPVGLCIANVPTSDGSGGYLDLGYEFRKINAMEKISVNDVVRYAQKIQRVSKNNGI